MQLYLLNCIDLFLYSNMQFKLDFCYDNYFSASTSFMTSSLNCAHSAPFST